MDLLEYQGKQLFARHGVPVPSGRPARAVDEAVAAADEIGYPCVVKAQVLIGGRGKAGGIKVAKDREEAREHSKAILGMDIRGFTVHEVWIEAASEIDEEYYASIVFDRSAKAPLFMLSTQGGMDIEEVAERDPTAIARLHVDPLLGFQDFHGRRLAFEAGVAADVVRPVGALLAKLYDAFVGEDAMLVEVNPLIVTKDRKVAALDAKVTLDDNALYRHPENAALREGRDEDPQEKMARERDLTYVEARRRHRHPRQRRRARDVHARRRRPGRRLARELPRRRRRLEGRGDHERRSRSSSPTRTSRPCSSTSSAASPAATRWPTAWSPRSSRSSPSVPFVVRLDGTNDVEGRKILAEAQLPNVEVAKTMDEAAAKVVEAAKR